MARSGSTTSNAPIVPAPPVRVYAGASENKIYLQSGRNCFPLPNGRRSHVKTRLDHDYGVRFIFARI